MKKNSPLIILLAACWILATSCKTQYALKHQLYINIESISNKIDTAVIRDFGQVKSDSAILSAIRKLDNIADEVKNKKMRIKIKTYGALANKVLLLHQDQRLNYYPLGQILGPYTQSTVDAKEALLAYKNNSQN